MVCMGINVDDPSEFTDGDVAALTLGHCLFFCIKSVTALFNW